MASNFPAAIDAKGSTLFTLKDRAEAALTSAIDAAVATIPVSDLSQFDSWGGVAWIGTEQIMYTGKSAASGAGNLTGVTRGYGTTTATTHKALDAVQQRVGNKHVDSLVDAVLAIEGVLVGTSSLLHGITIKPAGTEVALTLDLQDQVGATGTKFLSFAVGGVEKGYAAWDAANGEIDFVNASLAVGGGSKLIMENDRPIQFGDPSQGTLKYNSGTGFVEYSGVDWNLATGQLRLGGTVIFENDRDLAANLLPNADNSLTAGSSSRRFASVSSVIYDVYAAAGAANPVARMSSMGFQLGPGAGSPLDLLWKRTVESTGIAVWDANGSPVVNIDPKSGAHAIVWRSGSTYYSRDRTGQYLASSTTDIGAVVNAAISYVVATNGTGMVAVEGATYNQTTSINMRSGVVVEGSGRESTIFQRQADIIQVAFTEQAGTTNSQNASYLRGVSLKGTSFAYTQPLVKLVNVKVSGIEDCNIQDCGGDGIYLTGDTGTNLTFWVRIARCTFLNGGSTNTGAFIHTDTNAIDGLFEDLIFDGASGASIKGFWFQSGGFRVSRCWINRTKNSIHVDGSLAAFGGLWFNDVILDHPSQHGFLLESTVGDVTDVHTRNMEIMFAGYLNSGLYDAIHIYPGVGRTIGKVTFEKVRSADTGTDKDVAWNIYEDLSAGGTLSTVRYHDVHFSQAGLTGDIKIGTVSKIDGLAADPFRKVGTVLDYILEGYTNGGGGRPALQFRKAAGSLDTPSAVTAFDNLGGVNASGYTGSGWSASAVSVRFWTAGAFTPTSTPTYMTFGTTPSASVTQVERMRIDANGSVAIALAGAAQTYKLEMGGDVRIQSANHLYLGGTGNGDFTAGFKSVTGGAQMDTGDLKLQNNLFIVGNTLISNTATTQPAASPLYIEKDASFDVYLETNNDSSRAQITFRRTGGSQAAKTAVPAFTSLGGLAWQGYGTTYGSNVAAIRVFANNLFTDASQGTYMEFLTTPTGSATQQIRLRIDNAGNFGFNNTSPFFLGDFAGDVRIQGTNALRFGGTGAADYVGVLVGTSGGRGGIKTTVGNFGVNGDPLDKFSIISANLARVTWGDASAAGASMSFPSSYQGWNAYRDNAGTWQFATDGANNGGVVSWATASGNYYISSINTTGGVTQTATDANIFAGRLLWLERTGHVAVGAMTVTHETLNVLTNLGVYAAGGDANAVARLSASGLEFGAGGGSSTDATVGRGAAGRVDITGATGLNVVSGSLLLGGTILFENDRDLAVNLTPNADNALTNGTAARRWASVESLAYNVRSAASDANVLYAMGTSGFIGGAGGINPTDFALARQANSTLELTGTLAGSVRLGMSGANNARLTLRAVSAHTFGYLHADNTGISFSSENGAADAASYDVVISRGAANRLDVAATTGLNLTNGSFIMGGTTLFNTSREFTVTLSPNADNTLDVGTTAKNVANLYLKRTAGSVLFMGANGLVTEANTGIFYDASNVRLGIGTAAPSGKFHTLTSTAGAIATHYIQHSDNTLGTSSARMLIEVGGASAGDPHIDFQIAGGVKTWALGLDNSDSDSFVLSEDTTIGTSNRLRIAAGGNVDVVSGSLLIGGTVLFENDRDLAVSLLPNADNSLTAGSSARRFASVSSVLYDVYNAASDANPILRASATGLLFGPGGASALDSLIKRSGAAAFQFRNAADSAYASVDVLSLIVGGTTVFESDRDLAVSLIPNADNTLALGSSTRRYSGLFLGTTAPTAANTGQVGFANGGLQVADGTSVMTVLQIDANAPAEVTLTNNTLRTPSATRPVWVVVIADVNTMAASTQYTYTLTVGATTYANPVIQRNFDAVTARRKTDIVAAFLCPPNTSYKINADTTTNLTLAAKETLC